MHEFGLNYISPLNYSIFLPSSTNSGTKRLFVHLFPHTFETTKKVEKKMVAQLSQLSQPFQIEGGHVSLPPCKGCRVSRPPKGKKHEYSDGHGRRLTPTKTKTKTKTIIKDNKGQQKTTL